jgi:hypothetical protein
VGATEKMAFGLLRRMDAIRMTSSLVGRRRCVVLPVGFVLIAFHLRVERRRIETHTLAGR